MSEDAVQRAVEPRLHAALEKLAGDPDATLPVIIVYRAPRAAGGRDALAELERRQKPVVERLRARLAELGVMGEVGELSLAHGLAARLNSAQIKRLAREAEVERLVLDKEDRITL